jgi:intein/homing endonuclease
VWNGTKWSDVQVVKTGERVRLVRVVLSNGYDLVCTREHKFVLSSGERVDAADLLKGAKLIDYELPVIEGEP